MAGKEPTAGQPYRAGDTTPTPWAEARERLADADTYWLVVAAKQLPFAPVLGQPRAPESTKKGPEKVHRSIGAISGLSPEQGRSIVHV